MDFVRLGERYTTQYEPTDLIEGYNSLIWTERFSDQGEFELKTFDIAGVKALLPEDTMVSHLETQHVMMVETHEINMVGEGADAVPELTVRGRAASLILEHRFVDGTYQKKRRMRQKYTPTSALGVLIVNAIDNTSGYDLTRGDTDPDTPEYNNYQYTVKDALPNVAVTDSVLAEGASEWWQLEEGILYPRLQEIMLDSDLGLRVLRPRDPNPGKVITVRSALADRGETVRTDVANIGAMRFDIYSGVDRSSGSNSVQFSVLQGHLDKPQYLNSKKDYKSAAELMSGIVTIPDVYRPGDGGLTGWQRRSMAFDAGSPELPPEPKRPSEPRSNATAAQRKAYRKALDDWQDKWAKWDNKRDRIVSEFNTAQTRAALRELKKQRRVDMFAGDVSIGAPYIYKTHYDLGDTVMLFGDYGKSAKMIVAEYVRTEDANGDRGFPGLVAP
jgi:hypothetical protein